MLESMVEWMGFPLYYSYQGAAPPPRAGAAHATIYPYGPFTTADKRTILLGLQNEREWRSFCTLILERPEWVDDPRFATNSQRLAHQAVLQPILATRFATWSAAHAIDLLDRAGIANAHVNSMEDVWNHPQLLARDRWRRVATPHGTIPALLPPAIHSQYTPRMDPVPAEGEHTGLWLHELGLPPDFLEA